jgi:hypothetical protein
LAPHPRHSGADADILIGGPDDDDFFPGSGPDLCAEDSGELAFPC